MVLLIRHTVPRQLQQATWHTSTGYCSSKQTHTHTDTHTHTHSWGILGPVALKLPPLQLITTVPSLSWVLSFPTKALKFTMVLLRMIRSHCGPQKATMNILKARSLNPKRNKEPLEIYRADVLVLPNEANPCLPQDFQTYPVTSLVTLQCRLLQIHLEVAWVPPAVVAHESLLFLNLNQSTANQCVPLQLLISRMHQHSMTLIRLLVMLTSLPILESDAFLLPGPVLFVLGPPRHRCSTKRKLSISPVGTLPTELLVRLCKPSS